MKRTIRLLLLTLSSLLVLAACDERTPVAAQPDPPAVSTPLPPDPDPPAPADLTKAEAQRLLEEEIDTSEYLILDGNTIATVDDEDYYIFLVASRADNKPVGQIAVSVKTGEKFNYEGEDMLGAYAEFALYEPETDPNYDWEGLFMCENIPLELLPMDNTSFEYTAGLDGQLTGVARIEGNTAYDEENGIKLTFLEDGSLQLSGGGSYDIYIRHDPEADPEA